MKRGRIVEVDWDDHAFDPADERRGLMRQRSVGFLVRETRKVVVIAQSWNEDGPADILTVGKAMVRKVRRG